MAVALDNGLFEVRVNRRLLRCQETRAQQDPFGAQSEGGRQPTAIGNAASSEDWAWGNGFHDHGHQRYGCHPANVAAALCTLGYDDVRPCLSSTHCLRDLTGHVHSEEAGVVHALHIVVEVLVRTSPGKRHDRWTGR